MTSKTPISPRSLAALSAFIAAGAIAQQVLGRATRDTLFLSNFDVKRLPLMMLVGAVLSLGAALLMGLLAVRRSPARVMPLGFATSSALLLAYFGAAASAPRFTALCLYLHMVTFGPALVSTFWSVVSERLDPRAGKRYIGWIAGGATLGGVVGGVLALGAARVIPVQHNLLVLAALHLACAALAMRLVKELHAPASRARAPGSSASAFRILREVPYLRQLALLVVSVSAMETLADYVLNARAVTTWQSEAALLSFFGIFHMTVAAVTFLLQTLLGRLALERFGLVGAITTLPLAILPCAATAAFAPGLWAASLLRGSMAALGNSWYRGGYELLFSPLAIERKRPTKTLIDVGCDRLGTVLGSVAALSAVAFLPRLTEALLLFTVATLAGGAIAVTRWLQRGYVNVLGENLTGHADSLKGIRPELGLSHTQTRLSATELNLEIEKLRRDKLLASGEMPYPLLWLGGNAPETQRLAPADSSLAVATSSLLSGDVSVIRGVLTQPSLDPRLAGLVIPLLENAAVCQEAVRALRTIADRIAGQLADALSAPETPFVVRRRVARTMSACTGEPAVQGLIRGLSDSRFEVRYQAGLSLLRVTEGRKLNVPKEPVLAAVRLEVELERNLWQQKPPLSVPEAEEEGQVDAFLQDRTSRSLQHVFNILSLVYEREPIRLALQALSSDDHHLRGTALEYLDKVLPADVKGPLWPFVEVEPERRVRA